MGRASALTCAAELLGQKVKRAGEERDRKKAGFFYECSHLCSTGNRDNSPVLKRIEILVPPPASSERDSAALPAAAAATAAAAVSAAAAAASSARTAAAQVKQVSN